MNLPEVDPTVDEVGITEFEVTHRTEGDDPLNHIGDPVEYDLDEEFVLPSSPEGSAA